MMCETNIIEDPVEIQIPSLATHPIQVADEVEEMMDALWGMFVSFHDLSPNNNDKSREKNACQEQSGVPDAGVSWTKTELYTPASFSEDTKEEDEENAPISLNKVLLFEGMGTLSLSDHLEADRQGACCDTNRKTDARSMQSVSLFDESDVMIDLEEQSSPINSLHDKYERRLQEWNALVCSEQDQSIHLSVITNVYQDNDMSPFMLGRLSRLSFGEYRSAIFTRRSRHIHQEYGKTIEWLQQLSKNLVHEAEEKRRLARSLVSEKLQDHRASISQKHHELKAILLEKRNVLKRELDRRKHTHNSQAL